MSDLRTLIDRNRAFSETHDGGALSIAPKFSQIVLSCVDARVDPAHYLSLAPGEVPVLRTVGGRVGPDAERDLAMMVGMVRAVAGPDGPLPEILVVHHTDCGMERLADPARRRTMAELTGIDEAELEKLAINDHPACLEEDIGRLRGSTLLPNGLSITGYLYDHASGVLREVVPA